MNTCSEKPISHYPEVLYIPSLNSLTFMYQMLYFVLIMGIIAYKKLQAHERQRSCLTFLSTFFNVSNNRCSINSLMNETEGLKDLSLTSKSRVKSKILVAKLDAWGRVAI